MTERPFIPPWERAKGRGRRQAPPEAKPRTKGGGATPYQLGYRFEAAIRGRLQRRRYFVMRAASSKGPVDLLAVGPPCLAAGITALFIQCKRRGEIGSAEWNVVYEVAQEHGGWAVVTMKLSENTVGFYRLDAPREKHKPGRPWTMFEPRDLSELLPPPTLLDKAA